MNLKKLDIDQFYQEENANYTKAGEKYPYGLGATILITPKQMIMVYNKEALSIEGKMVTGLGSHSDTLETIFANIFNLSLEGNFNKKNKVLNEAIYGGSLNYIFVDLVNQIGELFAVFELPAKISLKEFAYLMVLNEKLKSLDLGIKTLATISSFDPTQGIFTDKEAILYNNLTLDEVILYFQEYFKKVKTPEKYVIKNAKYLENYYTYQKREEEVKMRR